MPEVKTNSETGIREERQRGGPEPIGRERGIY